MSRWEHCPTILRACMNCKLPGALADSILKEVLVAALPHFISLHKAAEGTDCPAGM